MLKTIAILSTANSVLGKPIFELKDVFGFEEDPEDTEILSLNYKKHEQLVNMLTKAKNKESKLEKELE